jgi:hypothetical protein
LIGTKAKSKGIATRRRNSRWLKGIKNATALVQPKRIVGAGRTAYAKRKWVLSYLVTRRESLKKRESKLLTRSVNAKNKEVFLDYGDGDVVALRLQGRYPKVPDKIGDLCWSCWDA